MPTIAEQLTQLESDRQDLVSNLQTKGITGLTGDETFTALVPEVLNIQTGGGTTNNFDEVVSGISTQLYSEATSIVAYGLQTLNYITRIEFPEATSIGTYGLSYADHIQTAYLPKVVTIGQRAFEYCSALTSIDLPMCTSFSNSCFNYCSNLTEIKLYNINSLPQYGFNNCSRLTTLYLYNTSVVSLTNTNTFTGVTGPVTIYVPSDLISSYQTASNWVTLYNNSRVTFVAIPS